MPRKSTIRRLPTPIRQELDRILAEDRFTLDEILDHLRGLGADVSRSAVHRYRVGFEEAMADIRLTREMAVAAGRELSETADGNATPLIVESLHSLLIKARKQMADSDTIKAKDLADLARAAKDLQGALKLNVDTVVKAREETEKRTKKAAAETVAKVGKARGLSADVIDTIKSEILGDGG